MSNQFTIEEKAVESSMNNLVLECRSLTKQYQIGPQFLTVLDQLELQMKKGEVIAVIGSSGSGKSTLLNMLGGLDIPSSGDVRVASQSFVDLNEKQANALRNKSLGFVYQFHHLLAEFTAMDNVAMPLLIGGMSKKDSRAKANEILMKVGLAERINHKPSELSGGERQRVAIARALVHEPELVLMDEPTGNLDKDTASDIQQLIFDLNANHGSSFLIVTHDQEFAQMAGRILKLDHGKLTELA